MSLKNLQLKRCFLTNMFWFFLNKFGSAWLGGYSMVIHLVWLTLCASDLFHIGHLTETTPLTSPLRTWSTKSVALIEDMRAQSGKLLRLLKAVRSNL